MGALDINRFIDEVYEGKAIRAYQVQFRYGRASHPGLRPIPYDPETAKELLATAGWWDSDGDNVLKNTGMRVTIHEPDRLFCGDSNGTALDLTFNPDIDDPIDISDPVSVLSYLFASGQPPEPAECIADANGSGGVIDIADAVYLLAFLFAGGAAPVTDCCCPQ